jgi:hypothetical protein
VGRDGRDAVRVVVRALALAAAAGVLGAAFLPWTVSGSVVRDSFATVRSARLIGIGGPDGVGVALGAWYFVPAVVLAAVLAAVLGRERWAGAASVVVGLAVLAGALVVLRSPVATGIGVIVAVPSAVVAVVAGAVLALSGRRES